jgi:hypothetical protein
LCGGYHLARIWHFVLTIGYVFFFLIHIMQVMLAGWNNFRPVVSGFEVVNESGPVIEPTVAPDAVTEKAPEVAPLELPDIHNTPDDAKK